MRPLALLSLLTVALLAGTARAQPTGPAATPDTAATVAPPVTTSDAAATSPALESAAPTSPAPESAAPAAATDAAPAEPPGQLALAPGVTLTPVAYIETYYLYALNRPSNGLVNFRGFDNRHDSFTLENVALGGTFSAGALGGKLVLQVGATPSTYYLAEPGSPGAGGANASDASLWKYVQEAFVTWRAPVGRGLTLQLGLCASPVGLEVIPVKDDWNWSRSNLFFGFPFYHAGLRATYEWSETVSTTVSLFNGWNSVVDNNASKSVQANVLYKAPDSFFVNLLYFGGPERPTGALEGQRWRHTFDLTA